jgi:hypothetical protein
LSNAVTGESSHRERNDAISFFFSGIRDLGLPRPLFHNPNLVVGQAVEVVDEPADLLMCRIRVLGSQQNSREYLYEALQIAATGKIKVMTETYSLDEIAKAYERVENGQVRFRAVVTFSR